MSTRIQDLVPFSWIRRMQIIRAIMLSLNNGSKYQLRHAALRGSNHQS